MATAEASRFAVLEAKSFLSQQHGIDLVSRDGFIYICVEAAVAFMKIRREHRQQKRLLQLYKHGPPAAALIEDKHGSGGRSVSANADQHRRDSKEREQAHRHEREPYGGAAVAAPRRRRKAAGTEGPPRPKTGSKHLKYRQHRSSLSPVELKVLHACVLSQYERYRTHGIPSSYDFRTGLVEEDAGASEVSAKSFAAVPLAKLELAQLIKRALDRPFYNGTITRQQYSVIVLAVLDAVFYPSRASRSASGLHRSRGASVGTSVEAAATPRSSVSPSRGGGIPSAQGTPSRHTGVPSPDEKAELRRIIGCPEESRDHSIVHASTQGPLGDYCSHPTRQDPNAPLHPAVRNRALQLTLRAIQYFEGLRRGSPAKSSIHMSPGGARSGITTPHSGIMTPGRHGFSPHPQHPENASMRSFGSRRHDDDDGGADQTAGLFDSEFDLQVARLRHILEERFALDLTGTRAGTIEMIPVAADSKKHLPSTGAMVTSPSSPQLECRSLGIHSDSHASRSQSERRSSTHYHFEED